VYALDKSAINTGCEDTQCVESYGSDFILEQRKLKQNALFGCDDPSSLYKTFLEAEWRPYVECRDYVFGLNHTLGHNCLSDSDCIDGKCNLITGYCLNVVTKQEQRFVECLMRHPNIDPYILGYLRLKYSIQSNEPTSQDFVSHLLEGWSDNDCVSERELGLPYRTSYFWGPMYGFSLCVRRYCDFFHELDPIPQFPYSCAAANGYCFFYMVYKSYLYHLLLSFSLI